MTCNRGARWCAVLALLAIEPMLAGAAQAGPTRPIRFVQLSLEQGLPQSTVMRVLQDRRGYVWLATEDGLARYDGVAFHVYRQDPSNKASLPSSLVWDLDEDAAGDLWIGTGGGLAAWRRTSDTIERHPAFARRGVRVVRHDAAQGALWIGTRDDGLHRLELATGKLSRLAHDPADPRSVADDHVFALLVDSQRRLWVGTDAGLDRLDPGAAGFVHVLPAAGAGLDPGRGFSAAREPDRVRALAEDDSGALWVGTSASGMCRIDASGRVQRFRNDPRGPGSLAHDQVRALLHDDEGRLWVGTGGGLDLLEPGASSFVHYRHAPADTGSLRDDHVLALAQDRGGVLWVGTRLGGVHKWNPMSWQFGHVAPEPQNPRGLQGGHVTSFTDDHAGTLWVGTFDAGLAQIRRAKGVVTTHRHDPRNPGSLASDRVMTLHHDRDGVLWIGTLDAGLDRYDPAEGIFRHHPPGPRGPGAKGVTAILEDRGGRLWLGTYGAGLARFDRDSGRFSHLRHDAADPASLNEDRVSALAESADGSLWVATMEKGLARLDVASGRFQRFRHEPDIAGSLASDTVHTLFVDAADGLWAGTHSGLSHLPAGGGQFETFTTRDGLSNDVVYGIRPDGSGRLWLSTNNGLTCFDPAAREFTRYGLADGLQAAEFNFGAWHRSAAGELFFGGINGFNAFFPDRLRRSEHGPAVVLTAVSVGHRPLTGPADQLRSVSLGHRDKVLSLDFAALDYTAPQRNRYSYRLVGFDPGWVPLAGRQNVSYTNLDAGEYLFELRGATSDGRWGEQTLRLPVRVRTAPWRSRWALMGYALLLGAAAFGFVRVQQRRLAREAEYARRLEQRVEERTQELSERQAALEQLNEELARASATDSLTGLANRRFLTEYLERETAVIRRRHERGLEQESPEAVAEIAILMIDLDSFKVINDTTGHAAGDAVLRRLRDLLLAASRASDTVVRWGGDEFLLVGRDITVKGLAELCERIRASVAQVAFAVGDGFVVRTTCSIGWACYPFFPEQPDLLSWEQVLSIADRALYAAKTSGRDAWVGLHAGPAGPPARTMPLSGEAIRELLDDGTLLVSSSFEGSRPLVWSEAGAASAERRGRLTPRPALSA